MPEVSWELVSKANLRYHLPKTEKSADLAHYFSGMAKFCVKNQAWNVRGSMLGLNRIFIGESQKTGEIYWENSPVNFKG